MTQTAQLTLSEFLLARIAEDESVDEWGNPERVELHAIDCLELSAVERSDARCTCGLLTRYLAECEAKRRIVEAWQKQERDAVSGADWAWAAGLEKAVHLLALPYADHPDYRPERSA